MATTKQHKPFRRWPLLLIAAPAFTAVWAGWVGLGELCGFGVIHPFPGIWDAAKLNTAITLPIGVETYAAYAMGAWLHPAVPDNAKKFARRSAIGALALGTLGQVAYHLLAAAHSTHAPWPITMVVSALPVITLGFAAALTHLLRDQQTVAVVEEPETVTVPEAAPQPTPEPVPAIEPTRISAEEARISSGTMTHGFRRARRIVKNQPNITVDELATRMGLSIPATAKLLDDIKASLDSEAAPVVN